MCKFILSLLASLALLAVNPASAQVIGAPPPNEGPPPKPTLPEPVRAMLDAAVAAGDRNKVQAIVDVAKATNPDFEGEIEAVWTGFQEDQRRLASRRARRQEQEIREAGLFELWKGRGQIGGFQSTGNNDSIGITASLNLERKGIDWTHKLDLITDYRRNNGRTQREQFRLTYEPNYQIDKDFFAYGLAQFERDRLQGYSGRYSLSGGIGYKLVNTDQIALSAKLGPAVRYSQFTVNEDETRLAALVGIDFEWQLAEKLKFTQDANAVAETGGAAVIFIDSANTSINLVSGIEAGVTNRLTTRLSWTLDYNSDPPPGGVTTDTLSRFTLIYGF